jgi:thiol-disulfide isomerase/thioredoxin
MGKAQRVRERSSREKIAAQQAAARRAEARRRLLIIGGSIVVVIAIVAALVAVKLGSGGPASSASGSSGKPIPASVMANVTSVPAATLNAVGKGSVLQSPPPVTPVSGTPLTSDGKPEMLYIGAEFCPYCAAMRWSMAVALSRFGHFTTTIRGLHSSPTDYYPSTPTLTFYKAGYASRYLTFTPVENLTVARTPLQPVTAAQNAIWARYEGGASNEGYPFIDFGNKYVIKAPIYNPQVLHGLTWEQVAADLHNPSSPVAQGALGAANYITAAICKITNGKPGSVCASPAITAIQASF